MKTNFINHHWVLSVVALWFAVMVSSASASRIHQPMIENIHQSRLIVIGDTRKGDNDPLGITIRVSEVIRGDKSYAGKDIEFRGQLLSTGNVWLGPEEKGIALLFSAGPKNFERRHLVEAYREADRVKALKTLIDVVAIADERKRIQSLQKLFSGGDPDLQAAAFSEIREMRNPENFDLLTQCIGELDGKHQAELITLMSQEMLDRRCIPVLIKALSSPEVNVRSLAAHGLYYYFPGAPGISEAFDAHLRTEGVTQFAARYLAMRFKNPEYAEMGKPKDSRWLRAQQLEKEEKTGPARALYFELIADEAESDYTRRSAAAKLIRNTKPNDLTRVREILLAFLRQDVSTDNYIYVLETTRILRALHHPDCLPALIDVFQHQGSVYDAAIREATMAIHELSDEARGEATRKIIEIISEPPKKHPTGNSQVSQLLALVWLANETEISRARKMMDSTFHGPWAAVAFMIGLQSAKDETAFLIGCLGKKSINRTVREWIVFRLGDLKAHRAVPVLTQLVEQPYGIPPLILKAALMNIGGAETEEAILKMLGHPQPEVRRTATDIICALQGAEAMLLCRRILTGENFGSKIDTLYPMAHHGNLEDLALLEKLCDYWRGDRSLTYHGGNAMTEIRNRYHHDLNGPIEKAGRFTKP